MSSSCKGSQISSLTPRDKYRARLQSSSEERCYTANIWFLYSLCMGKSKLYSWCSGTPNGPVKGHEITALQGFSDTFKEQPSGQAIFFLRQRRYSGREKLQSQQSKVIAARED